MNFRRRIRVLEKRLPSEPIVLWMPDGRTEMLRVRGVALLDLVCRTCSGERTPEIELVLESVSSRELGGGHMLDVVRSLVMDAIEPNDLNQPMEDGTQRPIT